MKTRTEKLTLQLLALVSALAVFLAALSVFPTLRAAAAGTDLYVGYPGRSNNFSTVQAAVDKAATLSPSSEQNRVTIHIAPGTYRQQVIVQTPCYNAFFPAIRNNRCIESHNDLLYRDGTYRIDFDDLERKAADPKARVLLLCNPHNPVGRVWTREELLRIADICLRNGVFVISDEIHCELTYPGHDYTPYGTLPQEYVSRSATCCSPTKSFNIAGIQIANVIATDPEVLRRIDRAINDNECCDVNVFGVAALKAAYNESGEWLDALRDYLYDNYLTVRDFLSRELPGVVCPPLEGTYLVWLDCRSYRREGEEEEGFSLRLNDYLRENAGLVLSCGTIYGTSGEGFQRLNIACPRERLKEGLRRLKKGLEGYSPLFAKFVKI